jgi:hypothetical protein
MNPPPIGEGLSVGWNTFKNNYNVLLIPLLCAFAVGLIPIVGGFLALPGMLLVSLKVLRGQTPETGDGFVGFQAFVDHLVMGILQALGLIACCIGVYVTQALFLPGTLLIVDKGLGWSDAKDRCLEEIKPNLLAWVLYTFVLGLVAAAGLIACGVGIFVTLPIATIGWAYAYDQTLGAARKGSV